MKSRNLDVAAIFVLAAFALLAAAPAMAQCVPYLCYVDLEQGTFVCPNSSVYNVLRVDPIVTTPPYNPDCDTSKWKAALVKVDVPTSCSGLVTWVQYSGEPQGFSLDLGDSETNDGFAGDSGSLPAGHNAELQVFDSRLNVYNAADNPVDAEELAVANLALKDGALNVVVENQFVSFGQPYQALSTPDLERLFFLPANPVAPDNRTLYVGINRVISPINGQNTSRNGCGARRVFMTLR